MEVLIMVQISARKKTKKMIIVSESRVFLIILFTKSIVKMMISRINSQDI